MCNYFLKYDVVNKFNLQGCFEIPRLNSIEIAVKKDPLNEGNLELNQLISLILVSCWGEQYLFLQKNVGSKSADFICYLSNSKKVKHFFSILKKYQYYGYNVIEIDLLKGKFFKTSFSICASDLLNLEAFPSHINKSQVLKNINLEFVLVFSTLPKKSKLDNKFLTLI